MDRRAFSVAIFARCSGRVLLIHHKRLATWLPVGGEIEPGETPLEAAKRELREETGLEGRFVTALGVDGTPPGLIGYEEHQAGSKGLHLNFAFVAEVDTEKVTPNDEFAEFRWVADTAGISCPNNVTQLVRMALQAAPSQGTALAHAWLDAVARRDPNALAALHTPEAAQDAMRAWMATSRAADTSQARITDGDGRTCIELGTLAVVLEHHAGRITTWRIYGG